MKKAIFFALFLAVAVNLQAQGERPATGSGFWYPEEPEVLREGIETYLEGAKIKKVEGRIVGLIAPHAGYKIAGEGYGAAYAPLSGAKFKRVVLLGNAHTPGLRGASILKVSHYQTPLGKVPLDREVCDALLATKLFSTREEIHQKEHSIENQLPFLQVVLGEFELVPILIGDISEEEHFLIADEIKKFLGEDTLLVASSDFVHFGFYYGYMPFQDNFSENIRKLDEGAIEKINQRDFKGFYDYCQKTRATICGRRAIGVELLLLPPEARGELLNYYRSADKEGNFRIQSVSYASIIFTVPAPGAEPASETEEIEDTKKEEGVAEMKEEGLNDKQKKRLLEIARSTLTGHFEGGMIAFLTEPDPRLNEVQGAFVTLHKGGELRGCIGNIVGQMPLAQTVQAMALSAATQDRRFPPVREDELDEIEIEISVMSPLKKIDDISAIKLGKHGVILKKGHQEAVYLPQVATETGWSKEEFLSNLCQKAGLPPDAWKDKDIEVTVFTAQVFGEKEAVE